MAYRLIVFDLGGVAVESEADRLILQVSQVLGRPLEDVQRAVYDPKLLLPLELGRIRALDYYEGLKRSLALPWDYAQFVSAWNGILSEKPRIGALLARLRARHRLSALSNTNELHIAHVRRFASLAPFQDWIASCEVGMRKPDPAIYRLALQRAGVEAGEAVFIDDRPAFVAAAQTTGLTALRFVGDDELVASLRALGLDF